MRSPGSSRKYRDRSAIVSAADQMRWLIVLSCFVAPLPVSQARAFCNRFSEVKSLGASGCNARSPQSPKSTLLESSRLAAGHKVLGERGPPAFKLLPRKSDFVKARPTVHPPMFL